MGYFRRKKKLQSFDYSTALRSAETALARTDEVSAVMNSVGVSPFFSFSFVNSISFKIKLNLVLHIVIAF